MTKKLNAFELSSIAQITQNRRAAWAGQELLRGGPGFGAVDVDDAVVLRLLIDAAGPKRGKDAWSTVRAAFRESVPAKPRQTWVVIDMQLHKHALCATPTGLAKAAALDRPVRVVLLTAELRKARARLTEATRRGVDSGSVTELFGQKHA